MSDKLTLNLDDLTVDSFDPTPDRISPRGTVRGRAELIVSRSPEECLLLTGLVECDLSNAATCVPTNEDFDRTCGVCASPTGYGDPYPGCDTNELNCGGPQI